VCVYILGGWDVTPFTHSLIHTHHTQEHVLHKVLSHKSLQQFGARGAGEGASEEAGLLADVDVDQVSSSFFFF
jgi:hypothetical protein